jgi:hypothetical protein
LDGLRNLGRSSGVRLALGTGVVGLILVLGQGRICEIDRRMLTALGRAFSTSLGAFCWIPEGTDAVLEMVVEKDGEVKLTLGLAGSVRLSSSRHDACRLVVWVVD